MNKNIRIAFLLCVAIATIFLTACGDSVEADGQAVVDVDDTSLSKEMASSSSSSAKSSSSEALYPESFRPDDAEYPYAGIPRIVIETEKRQEIKDRETEIPAKLQIWGEDKAESEILDLTIRGRGNTSWKCMPKKSYKIEFEKKRSMLGMPKDKDWALISNYADKTLMRNYLMYRLSAALGAYYAPRCEFAEMYLNGEYMGVYLLTETIKIGKNRINVPKDDNSYIVEIDGKYRENETVFFSDIVTNNGKGKAFRVHDPKSATEAVVDTILEHVQNFEKYLETIQTGKDNKVEEWIDVDESVKHYWIQELSKNPDGNFYTSVYFSWVYGETIKMGPVWDFDLAFGNHSDSDYNLTENWHVRNYWNYYLFHDSLYKEKVLEVWKEERGLFESVVDSIEIYYLKLNPAARNNFNRWKESSEIHDNAVKNLKNWVSQRILWIDENLR